MKYCIMIRTPFGEIQIFINGREEEGTEMCPLPGCKKNFTVDERYQVFLKKIEEGNVIDCILNTENSLSIRSVIESGENLALISFYKDNTKLSIGLVGDRKGIKYEYLENGMRMVILEKQPNCFMPMNIAWLCMKNPELEDIYCWLAADPTL